MCVWYDVVCVNVCVLGVGHGENKYLWKRKFETFNLTSLRTDPPWAARHRKRASSLHSQGLRAVLCLQLPPPPTERGAEGGTHHRAVSRNRKGAWPSLPRHSAGDEPSGPPSKQRTWGAQGGSFLKMGDLPCDIWELDMEPRRISLPFFLVLGTRPCRRPCVPSFSCTQAEGPSSGLAGTRGGSQGAGLGPHQPP